MICLKCWYRVHSDRFLEQGGYWGGTVTLLKSYKDTNYSVCGIRRMKDDQLNNTAFVSVYYKTNTSFYLQWNSTSTRGDYWNVICCQGHT